MSPNRKRLFEYGRIRQPGYVRGFREDVRGRSMIRVQWMRPAETEGGKPSLATESFDDTRKGLAEAKDFARGVHERLTGTEVTAAAPIAERSVQQLYYAYLTAKETEWSYNTIRLSKERWGKFELFIGRDRLANTVTREHLDELKKALLDVDHAPNQVKHILKEVVRVYTWGVDRDLIAPTKVTNYVVKFRRAAIATAPKMAEYSGDERRRMIAVLDPRKPTEWRPWVMETLLGFCGPRVDAALSLEISDVTLTVDWTAAGPVFGGSIHWRPETDKMGTERLQPLPEPVAEAFWVALGYRQLDGYSGRFVFYGAQRRTRAQATASKRSMEGVTVDEKPWTYSAYNGWLLKIEARAGIEHVKYRAAHGKRRGVAGDVHDATGSEKTAAEWIGDRSIRVVRDRYLLDRLDRQKDTARLVGGNRNEPQPTPTAPETTKSEAVVNQQLTGEPAVGIEPTTARLQDE